MFSTSYQIERLEESLNELQAEVDRMNDVIGDLLVDKHQAMSWSGAWKAVAKKYYALWKLNMDTINKYHGVYEQMQQFMGDMGKRQL